MDGNQHRVLIVDDAADVRFLLATAFQRAQYETDVAESGRDAKRLIEKNAAHYCCVILDLNIPPPDGIEIARFIRATVPDLPVIVISGHMNLVEMLDHADVKAVVRMIVMKPINPHTLVSYVHAGGDCIRGRPPKLPSIAD